MGNARTVLRKMRAGQLHGGAFNSGALTDLFRETELYSMPLLFRDYGEVDYVRTHIDASIREGLAEVGLAAMALSDGGFAYLLSQQPIRQVADLRGTKLWILENDDLSLTALEIAGVAPVPLPLSDVYTGLQTGLIDTVAVAPSAAIAFQWHTKVAFMTDVPLMYLIGLLVFDERALAKLSVEDRAILESVVAEASQRLDRDSRASDAAAKRALGNQGIETLQIAEEELSRWHAIADQTIARLRAEEAYDDELLDAMLGHLEAYRDSQATP